MVPAFDLIEYDMEQGVNWENIDTPCVPSRCEFSRDKIHTGFLSAEQKKKLGMYQTTQQS